MRHTPLAQLKSHAAADVAPAKPMTRAQRLERWAAILEREPGRPLRTLSRLESYAPKERDLSRCDDSPLSVAYADPILRDEGLAGDRHGDAKTFFGLSSIDIHYLVCDCRYGRRTLAGEVAARIRRLLHGGFLQRLAIWISA